MDQNTSRAARYAARSAAKENPELAPRSTRKLRARAPARNNTPTPPPTQPETPSPPTSRSSRLSTPTRQPAVSRRAAPAGQEASSDARPARSSGVSTRADQEEDELANTPVEPATITTPGLRFSRSPPFGSPCASTPDTDTIVRQLVRASNAPPTGNDGYLSQRRYRREEFFTTKFVLPWPFRRFLEVEELRLEYKRLVCLVPRLPFDIYVLNLHGVQPWTVMHNIQTFIPPHSALQLSTDATRTNIFTRLPIVFEEYRTVPFPEYTSNPDPIPEPNYARIDASNHGLYTGRIFTISEWSWHLPHETRMIMDFVYPFLRVLYHLLLIYIRYLAVTSDFLPTLEGCQFSNRMLLRLAIGLMSCYIYSDPSRFIQALLGIMIQSILYEVHSPTPEIRDMLRTSSVLMWLSLHGFIYLLAQLVREIAKTYMPQSTFFRGISYHTIWDVLGMGLEPLPIVIKLGAEYVVCRSLLKSLTPENSLFRG